MIAEPGQPALLSIGLNLGGTSTQNAPVFEALGVFARMVISERERFGRTGLRMNIVFAIPGPMFQPDFEGVHANRLDRKNDHLLVVAAVPPELIPENVPAYAAAVLQAATGEARAYLAKRRVPLQLDELERLVDHLITKLQAAAG
jgi:hypothetical protein